MTNAAWCTSARSAISKQSWKMHDEYFQIAFCSFTNAHWNAPTSFRDFGRITFVIKRDDQRWITVENCRHIRMLGVAIESHSIITQ